MKECRTLCGLSVNKSEDRWECPQLAAMTMPMYPCPPFVLVGCGNLVMLLACIGWVDDVANSCGVVVVHGAGND